MKNFNQLFAKIAMFALLIGVVVSFTSCESDDDGVQINYYTMSWDSFSGGGSDFTFLSEKAIVESAFETALDVTESPFSITGKSDECDATVEAACKKAEESLASVTFTSLTGVYVVTNVTNNETIYTYSF